MSATYGLTRTVPPAVPPVTLAEAKARQKIDHADEDAVLQDMLDAAIRYVEVQTNRQLVVATFQITFDRFPPGRRPQLFPLAPLASVAQIDYIDGAGVAQTILAAAIATDYIVSTDREPGRIVPAFSKIWPVARTQEDAVTYTITAGWADAASVDERAKTAIHLLFGHLAEHREDSVELALREIPLGVGHILDSLLYDTLIDYHPQRA